MSSPQEQQKSKKPDDDDEFQVTKKTKDSSKNSSAEPKTQIASSQEEEKVSYQGGSTDATQDSGSKTVTTGKHQQEEEKKESTHTQAADDDDDELELIEEKVKKSESDFKPMSNSFLIFVNHNICYFDFTEKKWNVGDLIGDAEEYPVLPNASVILNPYAPVGQTQIIVSGGSNSGQSQSSVYRFELKLNKIMNNNLEAKLIDELTPLPFGLFEHQSVILHNKGDNKGISTLLVIGGKNVKTQSQSSSAVFALKFKNLDSSKAKFEQVQDGQSEQVQEKNEEWMRMTDMLQGRHSFSATPFEERYVYVYGGIIGNIQNKHQAMIAHIVIEKFDLYENRWEKITIQNTPQLSAFGHAFDIHNKKLYIVGGSNGKILQNETWQIDFINQSATNMNLDMDISTAMSKVCVRSNRDDPKDVEIYSFGGLSTEGMNCFAKLGEKQSWEIFEESHLIMSTIADPELIFYPTVFIE